MSRPRGFVVRPKFPLVEPEIVEAPEQEPMTRMEAQAQAMQNFEEDTGVKVPEKCKTCEKLVVCVTLSLLRL